MPESRLAMSWPQMVWAAPDNAKYQCSDHQCANGITDWKSDSCCCWQLTVSLQRSEAIATGRRTPRNRQYCRKRCCPRNRMPVGRRGRWRRRCSSPTATFAPEQDRRSVGRTCLLAVGRGTTYARVSRLERGCPRRQLGVIVGDNDCLFCTNSSSLGCHLRIEEAGVS